MLKSVKITKGIASEHGGECKDDQAGDEEYFIKCSQELEFAIHHFTAGWVIRAYSTTTIAMTPPGGTISLQ